MVGTASFLFLSSSHGLTVVCVPRAPPERHRRHGCDHPLLDHPRKVRVNLRGGSRSPELAREVGQARTHKESDYLAPPKGSKGCPAADRRRERSGGQASSRTTVSRRSAMLIVSASRCSRA